ncbi:acetyl-CoA C-acetyltransferase [Arthrobacter sp. APC 3897]|uniref:acetyl-CoA C-acetyltransferase n=1 Tax=Arthrobacter sp. APC 3897 TaxID=3035204 RepID=UPI0025B370FF|nr:acetyl-CoA C-acetyltransferase [Arthrobacter sp. APC 3897]MDN3482711.1 acetyl-CoA C-acetyltransferase [Arthrobacter sp. APC 3897]
MSDAYIVGAVRTPVGKNRGNFSAVHPVDLGAHVLRALMERTGVEPGSVDDVIFGCVSPVGAQAFNIARNSWLSAGLPESVPGTTIDRQCGSSQQAIHFAAQAVQSGSQDLVVAGGVEVMSRVPIGSTATLGMQAGMGNPLGSDGWLERFGDQQMDQFRGAELIAEQWDISREEMESFALSSHERAAAAITAGHFDLEIAPYGDVTTDQGPRPGGTPEKLAGLDPLAAGGRLTAALASQISDGAAVLLIASERAVKEYGLTPLARIHTMAVVGSDPVLMLTGPIPATAAALKKSGLDLGDIDHIEINEAFASVVLAWQRETGADMTRVNPLGGALALGHPLGATGARLMTTMVHELHRTGGRYGLQLMCEGGGMANATIIERI